mmetsp:Transcript_1386/g.3060  ORF Transcript_1386/g.3060 Transcript_1386/m.3060 type:complete len:529 (+) Transcript_1386:3-1589(+)
MGKQKMLSLLPTLLSLLLCSDLANAHRSATDFSSLEEVILTSDPELLLCPVCEQVTGLLMRELPTNSSEESLFHVLDKVCALFPANKKKECDNVAMQLAVLSGDSSLGTLSKYPPHALCSVVGACGNECCQMYNQPEQVHLSLQGSTSMAVTWLTLDDNVTSLVEYDTVPGRFGFNTTGAKSTYTSGGFLGTIHQAVISGLQPDTRYYYRVGDPKARNLWRHYAWSVPTLTFRTPQLPSVGNVTFGIVGDMGATDASDATVLRLGSMRLQDDLDFVFHVGDISYADGYQPLWDDFFRKIESLSAYMPYQACPGNHEAFFNFTPYQSRFPLLDSPSSGSSTSMYHSFDYGPVHVVAINTEAELNLINDELRPGGRQYEWLAQDLEKATNRSERPWLIVCGHRPMVCTSTKSEYCKNDAKYLSSYLRPLLDQFKVDLVVAGHVHMYERSAPVDASGDVKPAGQAPVFVLTGASGTKEQMMGGWVDPPPPSSLVRMAEYGFGVVRASATTLVWEYVASGNGTVLDTFTLSK